MLRKKSYMDRKGIITEGFFDSLRKYLVQYPALKKDKKVQSSLKSVNKSYSDIEKIINKKFKELGVNKKAKIPKLNSKDFI